MLSEKIDNDYKEAMKARDSVRSSTLSFLRAQLKNVLIDQRLPKLEDADVLTVIKKQIKQRQDSIAQFAQGGRQDLVDKEKQELAILKSYLPEEMSAEELKAIIQSAVQEAQAKTMKDMGNVMKLVLPKVAGRADSKAVSDLVRQSLS